MSTVTRLQFFNYLRFFSRWLWSERINQKRKQQNWKSTKLKKKVKKKFYRKLSFYFNSKNFWFKSVQLNRNIQNQCPTVVLLWIFLLQIECCFPFSRFKTNFNFRKNPFFVKILKNLFQKQIIKFFSIFPFQFKKTQLKEIFFDFYFRWKSLFMFTVIIFLNLDFVGRKIFWTNFSLEQIKLKIIRSLP